MVRSVPHRRRVHKAIPGHLRKNLSSWEATSDEYERLHKDDLEPNWKSWGLWRIPESTLNVLGDVRGQRVLEYGCGAARWSIALARDGADVVGLDFSTRHLAHARKLREGTPVALELVCADAERTPFRDESFDIVFCDWGAMTFCDPHRTVPEVARLLTPGGLFAFTTSTPLRFLCTDIVRDGLGSRLLRPYFGLQKLEFTDTTDFQLQYGDWLGLFHDNGFHVEALLEPRAPPGLGGGYLTRSENSWARSWPAEHLWKLRKR
jgi:SAM-dependent methyltransferase